LPQVYVSVNSASETALIVMAVALSIQTVLMVAGAIGGVIAWRRMHARMVAMSTRVDEALDQTQEAVRSIQHASDEAASVLSDTRHALHSFVGFVSAPRNLLVAGAASLLSRWRRNR
jgi:hypothetical protein